MTLYISFQDKPGLLTLLWNPVLKGFVWSHQRKLVLISTHQYTLAGWVFCKRAFFILFFVNMLTSPIISQVLWCHTSLFYWINSLSQLSELDDFVSFPSYGYNLETERYERHGLVNHWYDVRLNKASLHFWLLLTGVIYQTVTVTIPSWGLKLLQLENICI